MFSLKDVGSEVVFLDVETKASMISINKNVTNSSYSIKVNLLEN